MRDGRLLSRKKKREARDFGENIPIGESEEGSYFPILNT